MNDKIEVVSAKDSCSCNACMARNYDSSLKPQIGKRVDNLFEVHVNMIVLTLCEDCLASLSDIICRTLIADYKKREAKTVNFEKGPADFYGD